MPYKGCDLAAQEGGLYTDQEQAQGDTPSLWCQVTNDFE